jgi:hemoglobin-like flavoprotein
VRPLFRSDIGVQARKFSDMLAVIIAGLDDFDGQRPILRAMGLRHAGYGVVPAHYASVAAALLWALGHMLNPEFSPEIKSAWTAFIEEVSATMQEGASA